jgi:sugar phosphate isomerase/epimerase
VKYAICNETFEGWQLQQVFELCGRFGYQGIELAPFTFCDRVTDLDATVRRRIRDGAASCALELPALHWLLAKTNLHLTSADEDVRRATAEYLIALIEFAADLGTKRLIFGSPQHRSVPPGVDPALAWNWSRDTFARCADIAAQRDVIFCLEALPAQETNFVTTVDECLRMVNEVNHPGFATMLDVKSMASEPRPMTETIARAIGATRYVHANDANRREPGSGDVDFVPIIKALLAGGYDDWMSIEVFDTSAGAQEIARRGLAYLRHAELAAKSP